MNTLRRVWSRVCAFHKDERGAEGLEKVLIMAAVALPLLGLLIYFRKEINSWVNNTWSDVRGEGETSFEQPY